MKPTERLAQTVAPDGTRLVLLRHDGVYAMRADGIELMSTRRAHSEAALAEAACGSLHSHARASALIGGLGFGFTLRAALAFLSHGAQVVVAELLQAVIDWNRHPEWGDALAGDALRDPRVTLRHADVLDVLRASPGAFDAIMLDVDNGAEAFTTSGNAALYDDEGVRITVAALRAGGTIAYWSAGDESRFMKTLRRAGLTVTARRSRAHHSSGGFHTILVATKAAS